MGKEQPPPSSPHVIVTQAVIGCLPWVTMFCCRLERYIMFLQVVLGGDTTMVQAGRCTMLRQADRLIRDTCFQASLSFPLNSLESSWQDLHIRKKGSTTDAGRAVPQKGSTCFTSAKSQTMKATSITESW